MLGCALVYTVPATSALATCPETFAPVIADKLAPSPVTYVNAPSVAETLPAPTLPVTSSDVSVPTDVIFACAAPVTVAAEPVAEPAEPVIEPVIGAVTDNPDSVPTLVMFGCEAVVNEPPNVVPLTAPVTAKIFVAVLNVKFELAPKSPALLKITSVFDPAGCCKSQGLPFA